MTIEELEKVLDMQEEILQFSHFTNEDAWMLGNIIVAEAKRRSLPVAVSIRLNNGYTVFQYAADGTNLCSQGWMDRKYNTVKMTEHSSLNLYMTLRRTEQSLEDLFLDPKEYAACGGGFPIRVVDVGVIGAVTVS